MAKIKLVKCEACLWVCGTEIIQKTEIRFLIVIFLSWRSLKDIGAFGLYCSLQEKSGQWHSQLASLQRLGHTRGNAPALDQDGTASYYTTQMSDKNLMQCLVNKPNIVHTPARLLELWHNLWCDPVKNKYTLLKALNSELTTWPSAENPFFPLISSFSPFHMSAMIGFIFLLIINILHFIGPCAPPCHCLPLFWCDPIEE